MPPTAWDRLMRVARRQLALFTAAQALASDVSETRLRRHLAAGRIERWHRAVYAIAGAPDSWERRALAAQLAGGPRCLLTGRAAGFLHELCDVDRPVRIDLLFPRGAERAVKGTHVHTTLWLPQCDRARIGPFPLTSVERTIVYLADELPLQHLERVVLGSWREDRSHPAAIADCLGRLGRLPGSAKLRRVLAACHPQLVRARSPGEAEAFCALRDAGLPLPEMNWQLLDASGRLRYVIDLAYPDAKIAIEVDSRRYHSIAPDRQADLRRQAELEAEGWLFIRVTTDELRSEPAHFVARVAAALAVPR